MSTNELDLSIWEKIWYSEYHLLIITANIYYIYINVDDFLLHLLFRMNNDMKNIFRISVIRAGRNISIYFSKIAKSKIAEAPIYTYRPGTSTSCPHHKHRHEGHVHPPRGGRGMPNEYFKSLLSADEIRRKRRQTSTAQRQDPKSSSWRVQG